MSHNLLQWRGTTQHYFVGRREGAREGEGDGGREGGREGARKGEEERERLSRRVETPIAVTQLCSVMFMKPLSKGA